MEYSVDINAARDLFSSEFANPALEIALRFDIDKHKFVVAREIYGCDGRVVQLQLVHVLAYCKCSCLDGLSWLL